MEEIKKTNEEAKEETTELDKAFSKCCSDEEKRAEADFEEAMTNPEHIPMTTEETSVTVTVTEVKPSAKVGAVAVLALACDGAYHCVKTTAKIAKKAAMKVKKFFKSRKTVMVVEETTDEEKTEE